MKKNKVNNHDEDDDDDDVIFNKLIISGTNKINF